MGFNKHTLKAISYGRKQGWRVRQHVFPRRPSTWSHPLFYGQATWHPDDHNIKVVEAGFLPHVPDDVRAAVLWHEMGHAMQMDITDYWPPVNKLRFAEQWGEETDAWERGLAQGAELGYVLTPRAAINALCCLLSYSPSVSVAMQDPTVRYLATTYGQPPEAEVLRYYALKESGNAH